MFFSKNSLTPPPSHPPTLYTDLGKVLHRCPHLSPCFVEELYTDAEELLKRLVMAEQHWVVSCLLFLGYNQIQYTLTRYKGKEH